jgi:hypothetical protein
MSPNLAHLLAQVVSGFHDEGAQVPAGQLAEGARGLHPPLPLGQVLLPVLVLVLISVLVRVLEVVMLAVLQ